MRDALAAAQIYPLVAGLPEGLDTLVGERGYRFSDGEKQRLAIARLSSTQGVRQFRRHAGSGTP